MGAQKWDIQRVRKSGTVVTARSVGFGVARDKKSRAWSSAISTMTIVHNAATTIPNVTGSFDINLSAGGAFTYTGGGLYVAFDAAYPAAFPDQVAKSAPTIARPLSSM